MKKSAVLCALAVALLSSAPAFAKKKETPAPAAKEVKQAEPKPVTIYILKNHGRVVMSTSDLNELASWALAYIQLWEGFSIESTAITK